MAWLILFLASFAMFVLSGGIGEISYLYPCGLLLAFLGFFVELVGQKSKLWKTEREVLKVGPAPLFLLASYFFLGMLFIKYVPDTEIGKLIYFAAITILSSFGEQILIRIGYVTW